MKEEISGSASRLEEELRYLELAADEMPSRRKAVALIEAGLALFYDYAAEENRDHGKESDRYGQ